MLARFVLPCWFLTLVCSPLVDAAFPAAAEVRESRIVKTSNPPAIDGLLNDPAWEVAPVLVDFVQRTPYAGQPAGDATEVRLLRDDQYIYVGARMYQDPRTLKRNRIRRQDNIPQDDTFEVIFDTFHDHLRGFIFLTNPNGAKHDTQVDGFKGFNNDWDEVWDVRVAHEPDAWCAEFRIPVRILRFQPGRDVWGFNTQRRIQCRQEWDNWAGVPLQYDISHLGYAGHLSGFADLPQQRNLQVIPAVVPTRLQTEESGKADYDAEPSLDVKYVMGGNATLDLTLNTDFAQVEADDTQVNLTRFSLFFPEKREFFLESASLFDFGIQGDTQLFFSRRIGISDGEEVPILAGARLTQKAGRFDVGIMNMQTQDSPQLDPTNYGVVRVRRNLHGRSTVGGIFTNVSSTGYGNRAYGLDTSLWLATNVQFRGFVAGTGGTDMRPDAFAHNAAISYLTDPWTVSLGQRSVGAGFDPGIGFVRRTDIRDYTGAVRRRWRPNRQWSRSVDLAGEFSYLTDMEGRLLTRIATVGMTNTLPSGDHFDIGLERDFEQLTEDFIIRDPIVIPMAPYRFQLATLSGATTPSRPVSASGSWSWGGFYDGTQKRLRLGTTVHFSHHFNTTLNYEHNDVELPGGSFASTIGRLRLNYNHNPNSSVSCLIQYNSSTREFSANIVFRLIYARDSNIYFVFNERETDTRTGWLLGQRATIFKMTYRLYL